VPQTSLLLTRIYQHFYTTGSPKVVAQCTQIAPASAPRTSGVTLVHKKLLAILVLGLLLSSNAYAGSNYIGMDFTKFKKTFFQPL